MFQGIRGASLFVEGQRQPEAIFTAFRQAGQCCAPGQDRLFRMLQLLQAIGAVFMDAGE
ncbi:hypothetical protein D3C81_1726590 [compost metagenome]